MPDHRRTARDFPDTLPTPCWPKTGCCAIETWEAPPPGSEKQQRSDCCCLSRRDRNSQRAELRTPLGFPAAPVPMCGTCAPESERAQLWEDFLEVSVENLGSGQPPPARACGVCPRTS